MEQTSPFGREALLDASCATCSEEARPGTGLLLHRLELDNARYGCRLFYRSGNQILPMAPIKSAVPLVSTIK